MKRKQHHTPVWLGWSPSSFDAKFETEWWFCKGCSELETLLRILFQNLPIRGRS